MKKTFLIPAIITALMIVLGIKHASAFTLKQVDTVAVNPNLAVGKTLPAFTLQGSTGKAIKSSAIKGRVVLIDFWASWCMPCRAAIPHLKELYKKYHTSGFEILSVSIDQNSKAWKNAMLKEAMPWLQGIDQYGEGKDASVMMNALGIQSVPFAVLLDGEGKVVLINPEAAGIEDYLNKVFKK
jgi:thiol-disulfide isomerase/thioredoxin